MTLNTLEVEAITLSSQLRPVVNTRVVSMAEVAGSALSPAAAAERVTNATFKEGAARRTKFTGNAQEKKSHQTGQQIAGERLAQSALRRRSEERGHGLHHAMMPLQCASIRRTALFDDEGVRKTGHRWRCSESSGLLITSAAGGSANKVQVPKEFQLSTTHAPQSPLCCYNIDIKILFV